MLEKSRLGLWGAPKPGDAKGERTGGVGCHLWVELAAAFKDAQSSTDPKVLLHPRFHVPGGWCHL